MVPTDRNLDTRPWISPPSPGLRMTPYTTRESTPRAV